MNLLTPALRERLLANGRMTKVDHAPVVKLFNPLGAGVWLATELDEDGDILFGLAGAGVPEPGYCSLHELQAVRLPLGLVIERDLFFASAVPISIWAKAARETGSIRAAEHLLARCTLGEIDAALTTLEGGACRRDGRKPGMVPAARQDPSAMTRHCRIVAPEPRYAVLSAQEEAVVSEARQILRRHLNQNPTLSSWQAVMDYCAVTVRGTVERFHVLFLDRKNRLITDECLATGTVDHVPVYPREVLRRALLLNASALIMVHNHPAGDPAPSAADLAMTREIATACKSVGLTLHDHIIVGGDRDVSLRTLGAL